MSNAVAFLILATLLLVATRPASAVKRIASSQTPPNDNELIHILRQKLLEASSLLSQSAPLPATFPQDLFPQQCSCDDYCTGRCFAMQCAPCPPDAFSFPGGAGLCLDVGPLGTGLLCRIDTKSGNVTENACCSSDSPTCQLDAQSCCGDGSCDRCANLPSPQPAGLFGALARQFNNETSTCSSVAV